MVFARSFLFCSLLVSSELVLSADNSEQQNTQLAFEALSSLLDMDARRIQLLKIRAVDWPDASLGCPDNSSSYAQVLTPGHLVHLAARGAVYAVHTGGGRAVACANSDRPQAIEDPVEQRLAGLNVIRQARSDLADRLAVSSAQIQLLGVSRASHIETLGDCLGSNQGGQGMQIEFSVANKRYNYRSSGDRFTYCGEGAILDR